MSGLAKKNAAVKRYMALARQLQYKPSNVNLRYMSADQVDFAYTQLKKYTPKTIPTRNLGFKPSKNRAEIINEIKKINPSFKSNRSDTYEELFRKKQQTIFKTSIKKQIKQSAVSRLHTFLNDAIIDSSIYAKAKDILKVIDDLKLHSDRFLLMSSNGSYKILSNIAEFKKELEKHKNGIEFVERTIEHGSDTEFIYDLIQHESEVFLEWKPTKIEGSNQLKSGAFFPYYNKTKFDLSRYQIFSKGKSYEADKENCIIYALRMGGVSEDALNTLKLKMFSREVMSRELKQIASEINYTINFRYDAKHSKIINKGCDNSISIGLIENHYFINEETNITKFTIDNYESCVDKPSFPSCRNSKGKKAKMLTSYEVITKMLDSDFFEKITLYNVSNKQTVDNLADYDQLRAPQRICKCGINANLNECFCESTDIRVEEYRDYSTITSKKLFKGKFSPYNDPNDNFEIWFIDTETYIEPNTNQKLEYHEASCLCAIKYNQKSNSFQEYVFFGLNCVKEFIDSLTKSAVIYAHNLAFDFRQFIDHLSHLRDPIETGTKLKMVSGKYGYHYLVFKDSYSFLPAALSKLSSMLDLECGDKEVFPYTLINPQTYDKCISLTECRKHIKFGLRKAFKNNAIKCGAFNHNDATIDMKKYTIHYCMQDTRILAHAFIKFRGQIGEVCKLDILPLISLPQLADEYLKTCGVYDDCYSISGIAQDFIRRCCVGGRVMCSENKQWHVKVNKDHTMVNNEKLDKGAIADFDAVSLYPSAMSMLPGFIKGLPKVLSDEQCNDFDCIKQNFDAYYLEVEITGCGIKRDFPLLSIKDKQGIRNFTNNVIGSRFFVDNIALEDLIKFQHVSYKVIKGYYFNDGFNTKIKETITFMFNERLRLKKEGNNLQNVYKLLMNASYGKLIQKAIKSSKSFVESENLNKFVARNFKYITTYEKINDQLYVVKKKKSIIKHFTACHIASNILSMSKRLMNSVMCLAEDKGIKIYYQDTDSMHLHESDIPLLANAFKDTYGRDLIGKSMGQFHTDFDVGDSSASNIRAVESIFVGKKLYIDKLKYSNKFCNSKYAYHIRVKGVPTQSIRDFDSDYIKTYERLMAGDELEFDLSKYCPLQIDGDYRARKNTRCVSRKLRCVNYA